MTMHFEQTAIDTIAIVNYCGEGARCQNHFHGIIDTSYQFVYKGRGQSYERIQSIVDENGVIYRNVYQDVFGNVFYTDVSLEKDTVKHVDSPLPLNAFDTIKVGSTPFPAATGFVAYYPTHTEIVKPCDMDNTYHDLAFVPLTWIAIFYLVGCAVNNWWGNLINAIRTA